MYIEEVAARFSVSTSRVEQWFTLMGLQTPDLFTMRHFVLADLCRETLSENPFVSEEQIIENCLPIMQITQVAPIDPSTHPLGGEIFDVEIINELPVSPPFDPLKLVADAVKAINGNSLALVSYRLNRLFFIGCE